jgi:hypothetical protein
MWRHVGATWNYGGLWPLKTQKFQRAIDFDPNLYFEKTYSHWKYIMENKMIVSILNGFEEVQERQTINTPSLKRLLRGLGVLHYGGDQRVIS